MKIILLALILCPFFTNAQTVSTIAGNGIAGFSGDGAAAIAAQLDQPSAVAVDGSGNVYIADEYNSRIRKISISTGIITTVAGTGDTCGSEPEIDGVPATTVPIQHPEFVAVDDMGNFYITCDGYNIRKVNPATDIITAVVSLGAYGASDVAADGSGNLYIDEGQQIIKRNASTGVITTIAGNGTRGFSGDGGPAISAELDYYGDGIAVDASGNVYISDNNRIRKITASTGIIATIAGSGSYGYSGDGLPAITAEFNDPYGVAVDGSGNLYIADDNNNAIRKIDASTGIITTVAGNGIPGYRDGPTSTSQVNHPTHVAVDGSGNVYVADNANNRIRKITISTSLVNTIGNQPTPSKIFPNPATTAITIASASQINQVAISNVLGQSVYSQEYDSKNVDVDIADLPTGVYFVKINGMEVRKFVKE